MAHEPTGLGDRGQALWDSLKTGNLLKDALALEIARTADRLDEMDNIIQGKGVLNLMQFRLTELPSEDGDPYVVEVKFNAVMSEAKGLQGSLVSLSARYEALSGAGPATQAGPVKAGPAKPLPDNVSPLDSILRRAKTS